MLRIITKRVTVSPRLSKDSVLSMNIIIKSSPVGLRSLLHRPSH